MFQTDPRGVEADFVGREPTVSEGFRRTLVGLKLILTLVVMVTGLPFQTDPRGVEAAVIRPCSLLSAVSDGPSWG